MDFLKLEPGTKIAGRYELLDKLGAGAFGAVYRARQLGIDRSVALKLLMPDADAVDSTAVARFQREAKLSSSLEHPNTITIHDYGEWEGILYLAMEYVRGESLRQVCKAAGRLEPQRALRITRQILLSLQEAHSRGIIHRDMKPANIMLFDRVGEKDVVKVLDFGIAKFISNDAAAMGAETAQKDLTVAGRIVGTPRYMAPEQIRGGKPSPASDLYALGLILFEMLAGQRAVHGDSTISLIAMQLSDSPAVDPNDPRIPAPLRDLMARATAKDSEVRFSTAAEFIEAIDAVDKSALEAAAGSALAAPPPVPGKASNVGLTPLGEGDLEVVEAKRGLPVLPLVGAAVAALLLAVVGVGAWVAMSDDGARPADPTLGTVNKDTAGVANAKRDNPPIEDGATAGLGVIPAPADDKADDGADDDKADDAAADDKADDAAADDKADDAAADDKADDGAGVNDGALDKGAVPGGDNPAGEVPDDGTPAKDDTPTDDAPPAKDKADTPSAADAAARKAAAKKARDKRKKDKKEREKKTPADGPKEKKDNNTYKPF